MKNALPLIAFVLLFGTANAQKCLSSHKLQEKMAKDPSIAQRMAQLEKFTQEWIANEANSAHKTTAVEQIPIVVHVLYSNTQENISDAQIQSQMPILNAAFRKQNANFSNTPAAFQPVAADAEMTFCMAQTDPNGQPTTGITRTSISSSFDTENDYFKPASGGVAPWDPNKYMNIYICHLKSGTLGFTYPPSTVPATEEGIVIDYKAYGTTGEAANNQPNHLGTTAVHEIGHYFNLVHIWGPNKTGCGDDDGVTDTPPQDQESGGCSTFPATDNCTTSGNGIMFMNYMDYSDDDCMTMFTLGQKQRMKAALAGPRSGLPASTVCEPVSVAQVSVPEYVIAPNPANDILNITMKQQAALQIDIINSIGAVVLSQSVHASNVSINISELPEGLFYVRLTDGKTIHTQKLLITH